MNKDVTEDDTELKTSQSDCSATVSFSKSSSVHKMKNYSSLTCYVNDGYTEETFAFIPPSSGEKTQNTMNCSWSNKFHLLTHLFFLRRKERTSSRKQRDDNRYWDFTKHMFCLVNAISPWHLQGIWVKLVQTFSWTQRFTELILEVKGQVRCDLTRPSFPHEHVMERILSSLTPMFPLTHGLTG